MTTMTYFLVYGGVLLVLFCLSVLLYRVTHKASWNAATSTSFGLFFASAAAACSPMVDGWWAWIPIGLGITVFLILHLISAKRNSTKAVLPQSTFSPTFTSSPINQSPYSF